MRKQQQLGMVSDAIDFQHVVNQQRVLSEEYLDAEKSMVMQAFYNYALPLLDDPLPTYATLKLVKMP
jgi:ATP-dependent phosphofructokinase / diphosphate-dependent phosphofructokinase